MKKYLQITIVLAIFSLFVIYKQLKQPAPTQLQPNQNNPQSTNPSMPPNQSTTGQYKDGIYTGPVTDAYYGNIEVQAQIENGKITDIIFLEYPHDNRTSLTINNQAMPLLKSEAIQAQTSQVDIVSGASDTSRAFQQSLAAALNQAK